MIALDLPPELEQRLDALGKATGRGKTAIAEYLGDLEDFYLAETKSRDIREGRSQTKPLADVMRKYGLDN